jgi:signal transduction histidine kinase
MNKSLRWKFVIIMLTLIVLLMTIVCVFLIWGIQRFYTDAFFTRMEDVFTKKEMYSALQDKLGEDDPVEGLMGVLYAYEGQLGIDSGTRNYYILDSTGTYLDSSDPNEDTNIEMTPNLMKALVGTNALTGRSNTEYMDVAVPVLNDAGSTAYVVYVLDNKQDVHELNQELITIILEAVIIGVAIAAVLSFIISKPLLQPIIGMTKAAEAMAGGDFSRKIDVDSDDEIGILAQTFNDMAQRLMTTLEEIKKSETLRREFVANVSHELRTPLTSIRSYAETLTDYHDIPKEMENDFLHVILNESDRMTKIVQDLLELSRYDAGSSKLTVDTLSLEQSIRDVTDAIALEAKKHRHTVNVKLNKNLPHIKGDKARLEQVFLNILSNAVKYTPDGGTIDITSGRREGAVWIRIKDNGIGIPKEDLLRIFDRFYRVDKARSRQSGGTGLGLSIAREIVVRHGGNIIIDSVPGEGTAVTVTLPIEGPGREES